MARLRFVKLPRTNAEGAEPFFALLDQVSYGSALREGPDAEELEAAVCQGGALTLLITTDTIELDGDTAAGPAPEGGHVFGTPGYNDPQRCSRCGLGRLAWYSGRDGRSCADVSQGVV
ncbi:hypothetical protein [Streptomyces sp. NPDC005953]|uniref:hypothetical protein n=1 Tax=Streptomyces sp. NPDC005953 TaxID=3156719 RepID=UPI0033E1F5E4